MRSAIIYNLARIIGAIQIHLEDSSGEAEAGINWWDKRPIHPTTLIRYHFGEQTPEMNEAWEFMAALTLGMKNTVESNGANFIVFTTAGDEGERQWYIDHGLMYSDLEGDFILWEGKRYPVHWDIELEKIDQITTRYNIPLIKPVRAYERYKINDAHPNANGNLNMALDIVDFLLVGESVLSNWAER